jgi:hypothetical protein
MRELYKNYEAVCNPYRFTLIIKSRYKSDDIIMIRPEYDKELGTKTYPLWVYEFLNDDTFSTENRKYQNKDYGLEQRDYADNYDYGDRYSPYPQESETLTIQKEQQEEYNRLIAFIMND